MQRISVSVGNTLYKKLMDTKLKKGVPISVTVRTALTTWYTPKPRSEKEPK